MDILQLIESFEVLATGNICDADKTSVKSMDSGIQPLHYSMKVAGPAFTVECPGGNNLAVHQAISMAPANSVLVINVHGYMQSGHIGDIMSTASQLRGIRGIIIDGTCRDAEDIIKMKYPVFARGTNSFSNRKDKAGSINTPTECGGVKVSPGDFIVGDRSGVVVVPTAVVAAVAEKARAIAIKEMGVMKMLFEGKTTMEIYNFEKID